MLFRADSCDVYALNGTAGYAWLLRKSGKSVADAAVEYAKRYGISLELALSDVASTWDSWSQTLLAPMEAASDQRTLDEVGESSPNDFCADYLYCGKVFRVRLDSGAVAQEISPRIRALLTQSNSTPDTHFRVTSSANGFTIVKDAAVIATEPNIAEARIRFLHELVRSARAERDLLAVFHAAACGDEKHCVIIPGLSQSGKTTLAAALIHAGFLLYAEDTVMLEAENFTVPMTPFALMIREGSWPVISSLFPKLLATPAITRSGIGVRFLEAPWDGREKSANASAIVFVRFQADSETCLNQLTIFETVVRLKEIGFWVKHDYESTSIFVGWLGKIPVYELTYSRLEEAVPLVRRLLDSGPDNNRFHTPPESLFTSSI